MKITFLKLTFIFVFCFFANILSSQEYIHKKGSFYLKEFKIVDTVFYNDLCSFIFSDSTCLTRDATDPHNRRYFHTLIMCCYVEDEGKERNHNLTISFENIAEDLPTRCHGFFSIEDEDCVILKSMIPLEIFENILVQTENKKKFYYDYYEPIDSYFDFGPDIFSTWQIKYKEGKISLFKRYCLTFD